MNSYFFHLFSGLLVGLSAGLSPGPLLTLMIRETVRSGSRAGMQVALAPLISDTPIVILSLMFTGLFTGLDPYLLLISMAGAGYLFFLSWQTMTSNFQVEPSHTDGKRSLIRGILTNFLNPAPYIFWMSLGAPSLISLWGENKIFPVLYITGFYFCLVGSKLFLAWIIGIRKQHLKTSWLKIIQVFLGLFLMLFGLKLVIDVLKHLGLTPDLIQ